MSAHGDRDLEAELASASAGHVGIPVDAICSGCGQVLERDDPTLEQQQEIADRLSTRTAPFDLDHRGTVTTKGEE